MEFSYLLASVLIIIQVTRLGLATQDVDCPLPLCTGNSCDPSQFALGQGHEAPNLRFYRGYVLFFNITLGIFIDNYMQLSNQSTWHTTSFIESSVSIILNKESVLTRKRITSISLYSVTITNNSNKTKLTLSYLCILLIVNAHDTEVNPGPYKPKYPCQVCNKAVKWGQRGIRCDTCFGWYHVDCMVMSTQSYDDLNHSGVMWICHACGIPNYSSGHLFTDSSIELSNSFHSLASMSDENAQLGSLKAASSPIPQNRTNRHKSNKNKLALSGSWLLTVRVLRPNVNRLLRVLTLTNHMLLLVLSLGWIVASPAVRFFQVISQLSVRIETPLKLVVVFSLHYAMI